jgi:hypothetical protein
MGKKYISILSQKKHASAAHQRMLNTESSLQKFVLLHRSACQSCRPAWRKSKQKKTKKNKDQNEYQTIKNGEEICGENTNTKLLVN